MGRRSFFFQSALSYPRVVARGFRRCTGILILTLLIYHLARAYHRVVVVAVVVVVVVVVVVESSSSRTV